MKDTNVADHQCRGLHWIRSLVVEWRHKQYAHSSIRATHTQGSRAAGASICVLHYIKICDFIICLYVNYLRTFGHFLNNMFCLISLPTNAIQQYVSLVCVVRGLFRLGRRQREVHRVMIVARYSLHDVTASATWTCTRGSHTCYIKSNVWDQEIFL